MPTPTFIAIAKTVLTGSQATITFDSIPSTYTDLILLISARHDGAYSGGGVGIKINSATSGYSGQRTYGNGTGTGSSYYASSNSIYFYGGGSSGGSDTASTFGNAEIYFPNYTASTKKITNQFGVSENNGTIGYSEFDAGLYSGTSAISRLDISVSGSSFVSGSRFDLYGIKNS